MTETEALRRHRHGPQLVKRLWAERRRGVGTLTVPFPRG